MDSIAWQLFKNIFAPPTPELVHKIIVKGCLGGSVGWVWVLILSQVMISSCEGLWDWAPCGSVLGTRELFVLVFWKRGLSVALILRWTGLRENAPLGWGGCLVQGVLASTRWRCSLKAFGADEWIALELKVHAPNSAESWHQNLTALNWCPCSYAWNSAACWCRPFFLWARESSDHRSLMGLSPILPPQHS